jgi:signal peptide peptidase SppA
MPKKYPHVLSFVVDHPWAITPSMLSVIIGILQARIEGDAPSDAAISAALQNRKNLPQPQAGSIGIIPVHGVIAPRMNAMVEMSGGTTFETLTAQLRETVANKSIKTIVLDIDSPGGNVAGATEFAQEVRKARTKKPILAVGEYTMASAAYWIAAQATEVIAAPSAKVGSVGVYGVHDDMSGSLAQQGVKRTYLSAGEGKIEGNETEPLTPQASGRLQSLVDAAYDVMVADIVRGRGQGHTAEKVRGDWKAHLYTAADAKAKGLIDRVDTLDATLTRILSASTDADDHRALTVLEGRALMTIDALDDTTQEPLPATVQDRQAQRTLEQTLFELSL